jgi:glycosyltransferase involved in cell wall biosynthesis
MRNPVISIVLPVWNGERYLAEAIESILGQTFADFELIIVNDCSTDGSLALAQRFAAKDPRVVIVDNPQNLKLPASLNRGFEVATGRYFTWTSDDNRLLPDCLQVLYDGLVEHDADLVYSSYHAIDENGNRLATATVAVAQELEQPRLDSLLYANQIGASFLYKAQVHHVLGGYDTSLFLVEDYDFWVRAYLAGFRFFRLAAAPYEYRRHAVSLTGQRRIAAAVIPFLYAIRNRFPHAGAEALYRNRSVLLTTGAEFLSPRQKAIVLLEAFRHAPGFTLKGVLKTAWKRLTGKTGPDTV